jgi:hypothetical protein
MSTNASLPSDLGRMPKQADIPSPAAQVTISTLRPPRWRSLAVCLVLAGLSPCLLAATCVPANAGTESAARPAIVIIEPPEKGFFSKQLNFHGIPIKAHRVVADETMEAAYGRLSLLFSNLNMTGPKPANGPEGLQAYDPEAFALFDDFYRGRIEIGPVRRR